MNVEGSAKRDLTTLNLHQYSNPLGRPVKRGTSPGVDSYLKLRNEKRNSKGSLLCLPWLKNLSIKVFRGNVLKYILKNVERSYNTLQTIKIKK